MGRRVIDYDAWVSIREVPALQVNELPRASCMDARRFDSVWKCAVGSPFGSDNCVAQSLHKANVLTA